MKFLHRSKLISVLLCHLEIPEGIVAGMVPTAIMPPVADCSVEKKEEVHILDVNGSFLVVANFLRVLRQVPGCHPTEPIHLV